jgi:GTPase SAR1 family protein
MAHGERTFKVCLVGAPRSGKTTLIRKVLGDDLTTDPIEARITASFAEGDYKPTLGVEVHPLRYFVNGHHVVLNVWDLGGKYRGLGDTYFRGVDAFFLMKASDLNNQEWESMVARYNKPTMTVTNKRGFGDHVADDFVISAKYDSNEKCDAIFQHLAEVLDRL